MATPALAQTPNAAVVAQTSTTNGLILTPTCPTPSASNVMILAVENDAGGLTGYSVVTPSGWNVGPSFTDTTYDQCFALFWTTGFTGTSVSVTLDATTGGSTYYGWAQLSEWSGVNTTSPFNVTNSLSYSGDTSGPTTITGASVTPTITGTLIVSFWGFNQFESTGDCGITGFTEVGTQGSDGSTYAAGFIGYDNTLSTSGTAVTPVLTVNGLAFPGVTFCSITIAFAMPGSGWVQSPMDQMRLLGMIH
jgi:hypothetical protein